jgi:hypothetical protein
VLFNDLVLNSASEKEHLILMAGRLPLADLAGG